jgi:dihydrofolate synthase/folylpolyglutamate synthase
MGYFPYTYAVVGMMADKDMLGVLKPMLGQVDYWYCVDLPTPRAARANQIVQALQDLGVKKTADSGFETFSNVAQAYQKTLERAGQNDRIVVFGSFYTVSGVLLYLQTQKH